MPEHEISNSVNVFLVFISSHYYYFFLQNLKGSAGSAVPEVPRSFNSQFSHWHPTLTGCLTYSHSETENQMLKKTENL